MPARDAILERLVDQVREAASRASPLQIRGGGTKSFYGERAVGDLLDAAPLSGITSYEPTELVVTARAGTSLLELEAVLEADGQCLPFEPPRFSANGTVGGMVAAGLSGPARPSVGSVRDHVLGMTLLDGRGDVLSFGGQVTKNVAGYDVSRLVTGSLGILGVICEVSLKVLPAPLASATLLFDCDEASALDQLRSWSSQPLPITATAWVSDCLHVRLAGARAAVSEACEKLGGESAPTGDAEAWWPALRDQRHEFFASNTDALERGERLWRLSVPPARPLDLLGRQLIEWGGAQRWWWTNASTADVRAIAVAAGGHATLLRGVDKSGGVFSPLNEVLMRVHRGLKDAFDPQRIFNPGRLYAGL